MSQGVLIDEIGASVREVYQAALNAGHKAEAAWFVAGRALGITPRRVRSYCTGRVTALPAVEYLTVRQRMRAWMEADIARCEARTALLNARLQADQE